MNRRFSLIGAALLLVSCTLLKAAESFTLEEQEQYASLEANPLTSYKNVDVAQLLTLRSKLIASSGETLNPHESIGRYALKAIDQPYRLNAVQHDWAEVDCVVFVNRAIAMAVSKDWASYCRVTECLMHKNGAVEYKNRNFSTLGDWLPNNLWLLEDITSSLPGVENFTHVIRPKVFREVKTADSVRTIFVGHDWKTKNTVNRTESFVPRDRIVDVLEQLQTGDVALVIYGVDKRPGCDHMGLIVRDNNDRVAIIHATKPRVRKVALTQFVDDYPRISGFKFLRLRANASSIVDDKAIESVEVAVPSQLDAKIQRLRDARAKKIDNP